MLSADTKSQQIFHGFSAELYVQKSAKQCSFVKLCKRGIDTAIFYQKLVLVKPYIQ